MAMTVETEHQLGQLVDVVIEGLCHVIVELLGERRSMHTNDRAVELICPIGPLGLDKVEIGNWLRVIVLDGVGIEAHKLHSACDKSKVGIAKSHLVSLCPCTETVVIAQECHKGFVEFLEPVASPEKFLCTTKVGHVASMNHKVDIWPAVDVAHLVTQVIEPLV